MIFTYILGSGYLSDNLRRKITSSKVFSAKDFIKNFNNINNKKINLIINSSYSVNKLNYFQSYKSLINKSIYEISKILDLLNPSMINKIIYTSSSSVYGSISNDKDITEHNNRRIYASLKLSVESMIKNFCYKNYVKLSICRVFNMYGRDENFSIIKKLDLARKNKYKLTIYNKGNSIRDFIHVDDVAVIYKNLLKNNTFFKVYDVGTGKGISIIEIINKVAINRDKILFKKKKVKEISLAIANNKDIKKILKKKFKSVESYFGTSKKFNYITGNKKNFI
jgi:nucleoside-diphosphate-sugar epimerase